MFNLPRQHGAYALFLSLQKSHTLEIGSLGGFCFPAGTYVYCGSAFNPGGIRARLGRHLRGASPTPYWHIDYLRRISHVAGACWLPITSPTGRAAMTPPIECQWSQALVQLPDAHLPCPGFGASDCPAGCAAHLVAFPRIETGQSDKTLETRLKEVLSNAGTIPVEGISCF